MRAKATDQGELRDSAEQGKESALEAPAQPRHSPRASGSSASPERPARRMNQWLDTPDCDGAHESVPLSPQCRLLVLARAAR